MFTLAQMLVFHNPLTCRTCDQPGLKMSLAPPLEDKVLNWMYAGSNDD